VSRRTHVLLQTHLELEHPSNLDIMANPSGTEDHNQNGGYIPLIANNGKSITQYFPLQADKRRQATLEISFGNTTTYSRRLLRVPWKRMPVRRPRRKEKKNSKTRKSKASNLLLRRSRAPFAILRLVGFILTYPLPWLTILHSIAGAKFLIWKRGSLGWWKKCVMIQIRLDLYFKLCDCVAVLP